MSVLRYWPAFVLGCLIALSGCSEEKESMVQTPPPPVNVNINIPRDEPGDRKPSGVAEPPPVQTTGDLPTPSTLGGGGGTTNGGTTSRSTGF